MLKYKIINGNVEINLVSDMQYLYNEDYKVFLKEYKKTWTNGDIDYAYVLEIVKWLHFQLSLSYL